MVEAGSVVSFYYAVYGEDGSVLDRSQYGEPLEYLHGSGNIVPGLERALAGKRAGDRVEVVVPPEEAYGPRDESRILRVPRGQLPADVIVQPGMRYSIRAAGGQSLRVTIADVDGDTVVLDLNHPMAGLTLRFDVTIAAVRAGTEAELAHGHPHARGSHH